MVIHEDDIFDGMLFYYSTENPHYDNTETMIDFIENIIDFEPDKLYLDGSYAEMKLSSGELYGINASGNGDSFNHKIEFCKKDYE